MTRKLIIVSGISGSGKTFYTDTLKCPHIHFDQIFSYQKNILNFNVIKNMVLNNLDSNTFILDAYIFHLDLDFVKLKEVLKDLIDEYEIHFLYTNLTDLCRAQIEKSRVQKGYIENAIKQNIQNSFELHRYIVSMFDRKVIDGLFFLYRTGCEYQNINCFLETLGMNKSELLEFIKTTVADWKYQTIDLHGAREVPGYSKSYLSWDNILKTGIQFQNKSICDIGCFFGYFSLKASELGATRSVGYDQSCTVLEVAKKIAEYNISNCEFETRKIDKDFRFPEKFDIVLVLNMLHHIRMLCTEPEFQGIVREIFLNCSEVVFEINENEIALVTEEGRKENFVLVSSVASHRKTQYGNRSIMYFKKDIL